MGFLAPFGEQENRNAPSLLALTDQYTLGLAELCSPAVLQDFFFRVRAEEQLGNLAKRRLLSWSPVSAQQATLPCGEDYLSGWRVGTWEVED